MAIGACIGLRQSWRGKLLEASLLVKQSYGDAHKTKMFLLAGLYRETLIHRSRWLVCAMLFRIFASHSVALIIVVYFAAMKEVMMAIELVVSSALLIDCLLRYSKGRTDTIEILNAKLFFTRSSVFL